MDNISPNNVEKREMDFSTAIKEVVAGKKITKLEWANSNIYGVLKDDILMLYKEDGKFYQWILSLSDIVGDDYIIV